MVPFFSSGLMTKIELLAITCKQKECLLILSLGFKDLISRMNIKEKRNVEFFNEGQES